MTTLADLQRRNLAGMGRTEDAPSPSDNNNTILQSDKPTDKQTDTPTHQQTTKLTDKLTDTPTNKATSKLPNKPAKKQSPARPLPAPVAAPEATSARRVDGRTMRVRQDTADRTMVTSLRLAVPTIEALDEFCWQHRVRKQDVMQAALDMYFAAMAEAELSQEETGER